MDIEELYNLGESYEEKKDYGEMEKHYLMAVDGGNTKAMIKLGDYYKDLKNYVKMGKYYTMGIEKGDSKAMVRMGDYHYKYLYYEFCSEINNKKNRITRRQKSIEHRKELIKYYLMAVDYGNSEGMNKLGMYYWEIIDYVLMGKYYLMAIEKEDSDAMYNLGYYYEYIKNYDKMEKYYLMSIRKDNNKYDVNKYDDKRLYITDIYKKIKNNKYKRPRFNLFGKKDDNVKNYWFVEMEKEKINKGDDSAMVNLGIYYDNKKDDVFMGKYYLMAIEKGNVNAMTWLGNYYAELQYIKRFGEKPYFTHLYNQMKKYYLMAIEKGHVNAMYNLGVFYEDKGNYDEMKKYYLMVLKNDNDYVPKCKISKMFEKIKKTYFTETNELQPFL